MIIEPTEPFNKNSWFDWIGLWVVVYMILIGSAAVITSMGIGGFLTLVMVMAMMMLIV